MVTSEQIVKNLEGATLSYGDETFIRHARVGMSVDSHPDDIPFAYEPVTAHFECSTTEKFQKPAELELLSSHTDSSGKLVTILQKLSFGDEWKAVGLTKPVGNQVKLQINASCGLIGVVLKSEQRPIGSNDKIINAPLPLSKEDTTTGVEEIKQQNMAKKNWSEEYDAVAAEFQEYVKKPVESSKTIGLNGGEIRLCGCALEFPYGALKEDKELSVSADNNPANFPPNLEPISVILGFKPSMQLDKPVTVSMKTWFRALEGQTVPVVLSSRRRGYDWKKVGEVTIGDTSEVKFTVLHFCEFGLGLAPEHKDKGEYVLSNAVFIQREVGWIHSFFYRDDGKSDRDVRDTMRSRNCVVFSTPPPLRISGKREQKVSIKAKLTVPVNTDLTIGIGKTEFQIKDILRYKERNIVFIPSPELDKYNGLVKGKYIAELDQQEPEERLLGREWPATLDPEGPPIFRQNIITAGVAATDQARVSYSAKDSTTILTSQ